MKNLTEELLELQQERDETKQEVDKSRGALDQILKQIKEEFGCKTLKEANKKLNELKRKEEALRHDFEQKLEKYKERWEEQITNE